MRRVALVMAAGALGLGTSLATGTLAAFSSTTVNPGNSFQAAASWCAGAGPQTVTATADAYVNEQAPLSNYSNGSTLFVQSRHDRDRRTLVQFALPAIPSGCAVTAATLLLVTQTSDPGRVIEASRLAAPWVEGVVTWVTQPPVAGAAATAPSALGVVQWDVRAQVQAMYAGLNNGFLIRDSVEDAAGTGQTQTYSSREAATNHPRLTVTFG